MNDERLLLSLETISIEPEGCFGILRNGSRTICYTLERTYPDEGTEEEHTIISSGTHPCCKTVFNRGGYETFEVTGIEGHSRLLFHKGNVEEDSLGCILLGMKIGMLEKDGEEHKAVISSKEAFDKFWDLVKDEFWFDLQVIGR